MDQKRKLALLIENQEEKNKRFKFLHSMISQEKENLKHFWQDERRNFMNVSFFEKKADVSQGTLQKYLDNERGISIPALAKIVDIMQFYEVKFNIGYRCISNKECREEWLYMIQKRGF